MSGSKTKQMKKLIVCCDGTWMNSNQGLKNTDSLADPKDPVLQTPTNVTRICRCVSQEDDFGNQQIAYYQSGVGTTDILDKVVGGVTGLGLSEHIREAYHFICQNYDQNAGDEIYLVGFSRGSFTARSIASFISDLGLLTPAGMTFFYPIFQDWENQLKPLKEWKPNPNLPFKGPRPNLYSNADAYVAELVKLGYTRPNISVKAVACYDTVGSLGIPRIGIFDTDHAHHGLDYAFVDTSVPPMVENAIHGLALDEKREPFAPTLWELPNPQPGQTLTQVWFSGAHADVGGSYDDTRSADISLTWMISQLSKYIAFDLDLVKLQFYRPATEEAKRPWACGQIHNPFTLAYWAGGVDIRTPMDYNFYDHSTGKEKVPKQPLVNTQERMHSSVRLRMGIPGKGLEDKGDYNPEAMDGWKVHGTAPASAPGPVTLKQIQDGQKGIYWQNGDKKLPEELLTDLEWELMMTFTPTIEAKFLNIVPK